MCAYEHKTLPTSLSMMVTMELTDGMLPGMSGGREKEKSIANVSGDSGFESSVMMISKQASDSPGLNCTVALPPMKSSISA